MVFWDGTKSPESDLGLIQGAKILYFFDNLIISLSSVVNKIWLNCFDLFATKNVCSIRPGFGLHPKYLPEIIGKVVVKNLTKGDRFSMNFIKNS